MAQIMEKLSRLEPSEEMLECRVFNSSVYIRPLAFNRANDRTRVLKT